MISQNRTSNVGFVTPWPTDDAGISRRQAREIQQALLNRGYDIGQADGMIGDKTRYAIQDFQRQQGVNPDGRAGMKLYRMLITQPTGNAQYPTQYPTQTPVRYQSVPNSTITATPTKVIRDANGRTSYYRIDNGQGGVTTP